MSWSLGRAIVAYRPALILYSILWLIWAIAVLAIWTLIYMVGLLVISLPSALVYIFVLSKDDEKLKNDYLEKGVKTTGTVTQRWRPDWCTVEYSFQFKDYERTFQIKDHRGTYTLHNEIQVTVLPQYPCSGRMETEQNESTMSSCWILAFQRAYALFLGFAWSFVWVLFLIQDAFWKWLSFSLLVTWYVGVIFVLLYFRDYLLVRKRDRFWEKGRPKQNDIFDIIAENTLGVLVLNTSPWVLWTNHVGGSMEVNESIKHHWENMGSEARQASDRFLVRGCRLNRLLASSLSFRKEWLDLVQRAEVRAETADSKNEGMGVTDRRNKQNIYEECENTMHTEEPSSSQGFIIEADDTPVVNG